MLELLQTHGPLSGPELAHRLEVNVRTLRRYITMLQELGIPVENAGGRYGAYRLRPGYKVPPLMFTEDEAVAMTLGLLITQRLGSTIAAPAAESARTKIERVLPLPLHARVQAVQDSVVLDVARAMHIPAGTIVSTLSVATQEGRTVQMRYRSWEGQATNRAVDPYGVLYHGGRWFMVGYCHLRVEVLLTTTLEEAQQKVPPDVATLQQAHDGVVLCCYVASLEWMAYTLAGIGCPIVVRQPDELRDELRRLAASILRIAEA
jgi:predicted DNA-binding transcriptional regulator YafY